MTNHFSRVYAAQTVGLSAHIISVETDIVKNTLHAFSIVGLPDKAVEEARDRVSAAIKNIGFASPKSSQQKTIISLAPADIRKEGPIFDVALAIGFLLADEQIICNPEHMLFLGELALDGGLRPGKGILPLAREAKKRGFTDVFVPEANAAEAALIEGIAVYSVRTLGEIVEHIDETDPTKKDGQRKNIARTELVAEPHRTITPTISRSATDMADVRGQESAKRGLEIAAAGGHNVCMYGPPGTGKTMLARAFAGLLPPLDMEEALEITAIHSVAGTLEDVVQISAPFRAPHHTASHTSIIGGGTIPKPGEVTLAHHGVLFMDEFPEFDKRVIEALRQPLEDNIVTVSRVKGTETFPANVILVAAMNPCPCGNFGSAKRCTCTQSQLIGYRKKLSGPIMDRIDIWLHVDAVDHATLDTAAPRGEGSDAVRARVALARNVQRARFTDLAHVTKNADMKARDVDERATLSEHARETLVDSARALGLSARAYHKTIKVARTIADMEGKDSVEETHILEALRYRPRVWEM
ncbi:MAG: YifB family Mg chelatase-like AAA ATPase [Candidatus Yonathbacteria bacterium]|nr:YifB family Mg chelatase-like AAA ATPase [Candidatus Yonathbacteria bacterium]NTW47615.1 YifB family Mg chelatase-like AAA ATPase [Candidatus Yonathbacteria bacterium]